MARDARDNFDWPPFDIPECPSEVEAVERTTETLMRGNTLRRRVPPVAELRIHYESQFRFVSFYKIVQPTPFWDNVGDTPMSLAQLTEAVRNQPSGWLNPGDDFVHLDDDKIGRNARNQVVRIKTPTYHPVKIGRTNTNLILGESRKVSGDAYDRVLIWTPSSGTLPAHVPYPASAGAWKPLKAPVVRNQDWVNEHQWGIRGTLDLTMDPCGTRQPVYSYKMVCVWERWALYGSADFSISMAMLPASTDIDNPATFAGFPRAMTQAESFKGTFDQWMEEFPAIQVAHEWSPTVPPDWAQKSGKYPVVPLNPSGPGWLSGVRAWRIKNPDSWWATGAVCIHTGNMPNWFLGCQGPGKEDQLTEWGFKTKEHSKRTMWEILEHLGVSKQQFKSKGLYPTGSFKRWVVIRVTAEPDAITEDGWRKQSIWLPEQVSLAAPAGASVIDI